MKTWYSCKIRSMKEGEDGILKAATEAFLVDAVTYTDAETRINEIAEQDIRGEFTVTQISKTNIAEVIPNDQADDWFKAKVVYITVDGDSGKEMKINTYMLVAASDIKEAHEMVETHFHGMVIPYEVTSLVKTNFIEVYPFHEDEERIPANLRPLSEVEEAE